LQQPQNENQGTEIIPEEFLEIPSDSVFRRFLLEVSSPTILIFPFFKEALKRLYEFNKLMKQSF
jgi:hypothetical protein